MIKKIIISLIFIVVLIINLFGSSVFATGICHVYSKVDRNAVEKDGVFVMNVIAAANKELEIKKLDFDIIYDKSIFDVLDIIQEQKDWEYNIDQKKGTIKFVCNSKSNENVRNVQKLI